MTTPKAGEQKPTPQTGGGGGGGRGKVTSNRQSGWGGAGGDRGGEGGGLATLRFIFQQTNFFVARVACVARVAVAAVLLLLQRVGVAS